MLRTPKPLIPFVFAGLTLLPVGCSSRHGSPPETGPVELRVMSEVENAAPTRPTRSESSRRYKLSAIEEDALADPTFKRRLIESYIAETNIEPSVSADERDAITRAIEAISKERLDEAVGILKENATESATAAMDFMLATVHAQRDQLDEAARACEVATQKYPKFRRAWRALADIRYRRGEFEKARTPLTKVIELGGADAVTFGVLGVVLSKLGDDIAAESAFRMANLLAPDDLNWKRGMAETFFKQERFAEAIALFNGLIEQQPDNAELWMAQGRAYAATGKSMKAAQNFEVVDRLGKSTSESLNGLGVIYANEGLHDLAVTAYLRALELDPKASPDRAILAVDYFGRNGALAPMRRLLVGVESARDGLLDEKQEQTVLRLRQRLAAAEGADDEHAAALERLVELDPLDGQALIDLGRYHQRKDAPERAILCFERAASIEKFEAKAKLRHAELLVRDERYVEALPLIRRAATLDARDAVQDFLKQVERAAKNR